MSLKKPIQIFARLKPMSGQSEPFPYEIEPIDIDITNDEILVFNMKAYQASDSEGYYAHRPQENHRYRYSKVFDCDSSQEEIFEHICKPVIDGAMAGYNGTIFAYGQTGSGKTYTMTGSRANFQERGIIPRTLSYIFQRFQEMEDGMELQAVYISYLEIYNENGYDLLHPNMASGKLDELKKVSLMEDSQQQIHLKHLSVNPVADEDQAMHLFYMGEHHRTIAETPMNEASTRSHCVFTIHVHTRESQGTLVRRSKIHLVDLAGSERIANSNISGQLFNEARHINLALHYLEQVIVALGEANRTHIPYRNSMMTSILRDSLGGNCMTSMIATLSLESRNIPETMSTCRFSQRVALVTNDATLNEEVDPDLLIAQLKAEIKRLKSVMSVSSIKPISEDSTPLNSQEFQECCSAVQEFLMDPDDDALLTIPPDMRLVQQCFQCLKCACNETHAKVTNAMEVYKYAPETAQLVGDQRVQQLLKTLSSRENEIKVLSKMLKDTQEKSKRALNDPNNLQSKNFGQDIEANLAQFQAVTDTLIKPPYSPPLTSRPLIDKESLILEGFSERKKTAWENFLSSCPDKEHLHATRESLIKYRSEVEKIKSKMNKEHETLNLLKRSMMTSVSNEEISLNNSLYKEACATHNQTLAKMDKQLLDVTEEVMKHENMLKCMYTKMVEAFESMWDNRDGGYVKNESPLKHVAAGVFKRSDSDIDFKNKVPTLNDLGLNKPFLQKPWKETEENTPPKTASYSKTKQRREDEPQSSRNKKPIEQSIESLLGDRITPRAATVACSDPNDNDIRGSSSAEDLEAQDKNNNALSDCPITGDPVTDREILNFIRKRQAAFKKLHEAGRSLQEMSTTNCTTSEKSPRNESTRGDNQ